MRRAESRRLVSQVTHKAVRAQAKSYEAHSALYAVLVSISASLDQLTPNGVALRLESKVNLVVQGVERLR